MQKYFVHKIKDDGTMYWEEVDGEPVTIEGYEDFEFFSHFRNGNFVISELTTGAQLGESYVESEAIKLVIAKLKAANMDREKMAETLSPKIAWYGLSPAIISAPKEIEIGDFIVSKRIGLVGEVIGEGKISPKRLNIDCWKIRLANGEEDVIAKADAEILGHA